MSSLLDAFPDRSIDASSNTLSLRPPSPEIPTNHAGSELLNLIYPGRFSSSFSTPEETDYMGPGLRPFDEPMQGIRTDTTRRESAPSQAPNQQSQISVSRFERTAPSLPPLRFQHTLEPFVGEENNTSRTEAQTIHELPWRRPLAVRVEQSVSGGLMAEVRRSAPSYSQSLSSMLRGRMVSQMSIWQCSGLGC